MRRIIFVDDDVRVLDGLRRLLRPFRGEWECEFVDGAQASLDKLDEREFDVIVSDMRMPEMDGAELLRVVQQRHPEVVRLILSGQSERNSVLRSVGPAHQFLAKPCNADELRDTITRTCALRDLLRDEALRKFVGGMGSLPVFPKVLLDIREALEDEHTTLERVSDILSQDIGLVAKILQLVNSAFFGLRHHVHGIERAVSYLGLNTLQAVVLSASVFSQMDEKTAKAFRFEELFHHCLAAGQLAKTIAHGAGCAPYDCDHAFLAGVLHDIGKVILATNKTAEFAEISHAADHLGLTHPLETQRFGVDHAHIGAYLLGLWAFPHPVVEAVAYHHSPAEVHKAETAMRITPLTCVHLANALHHEAEGVSIERGNLLDGSYVASLKLTDRLETWRQEASALFAGVAS